MAARDKSQGGTFSEGPFEREEFSDFVLVLKNGRKLKCHKVKLAEVSPFFCTMLRHDCLETQKNEMKLAEFEPETVESFLDFIYTAPDLATSNQDLFQMKFETKRLTAELMRMCHMYQLKNLQNWCAQHLLKNVDDTNAIDIWRTADKIGDDNLKNAALDHLGKKGNKLSDVPGLKESMESPQLAMSLVSYMSHRDDVITVKVKCNMEHGPDGLIPIQAKLSDTVKVLRLLIDDYLSSGPYVYKCVGSLSVLDTTIDGIITITDLAEDKTLASYNLTNGSRVQCTLVKQEML